MTTSPSRPHKAAREQLVGFVAAQVAKLQAQYLPRGAAQPTSWAAATMAALRRATPGDPAADAGAWEITFEGLPESLAGREEQASPAERAAHAALSLYAAHQTSRQRPMHQAGLRLGQALGRLPKAQEPTGSVLRRFNSVLSASSFTATAYHLRAMVTLLRREEIPLDYARLAGDLLALQDPRRAPNVRLSWGRDYFRVDRTTDDLIEAAASAGVTTPTGDAQ